MLPKSGNKSKELNKVEYNTAEVLKLVDEVETLKKKIKELEAENRELLILKTPATRGDHEIIVGNEHFFINYPEMVKFFDAVASGGIRQPQYFGSQGAWYALAKILSFVGDEKDSEAYHAGIEKARQILLKFRGAN